MKTIGVKLRDDQAEAFQVAAAQFGLTTSAALLTILEDATNDFTYWAMLNFAKPRKRGRARKPSAIEELAQCFANGETTADLLDRFDQPRRRRA